MERVCKINNIWTLVATFLVIFSVAVQGQTPSLKICDASSSTEKLVYIEASTVATCGCTITRTTGDFGEILTGCPKDSSWKFQVFQDNCLIKELSCGETYDAHDSLTEPISFAAIPPAGSTSANEVKLLLDWPDAVITTTCGKNSTAFIPNPVACPTTTTSTTTPTTTTKTTSTTTPTTTTKATGTTTPTTTTKATGTTTPTNTTKATTKGTNNNPTTTTKATATTNSTATAPTTTDGDDGGGIDNTVLVGSVVGAMAFLLLVIIIVIICCARDSPKPQYQLNNWQKPSQFAAPQSQFGGRPKYLPAIANYPSFYQDANEY